MPVRHANQLRGEQGERLVREQFNNHPRWIAREQGLDFGIDFEAELADRVKTGQALRGQLIKVQVKSLSRLRSRDMHIHISIKRAWIDYACALRIPVILAAYERTTRRCWWLWVQGWALDHEDRLASNDRPNLTVQIPASQRLDDRTLANELPAIAEGRSANAMVLALRGVLDVAHGWENQEIARGVVALLGRTQSPSRAWTIGKVVDALTKLGPNPGYWEAQVMLPILLALVENGGDTFTQTMVLQMVQRGDSYSRVGLNTLEVLYNIWPDHAASLALPFAFTGAGLDEVAWYAAMRERFCKTEAFAFFLAKQSEDELRHGPVVLRLDGETRDYIFAKWPNRGDTVLLDCLRYEPAV